MLFFSLLCFNNAINSSMTPTHSHMIPNAIFSDQNQNSDITIHVIAKIKIPLLLMIFLLKIRIYRLYSPLNPHIFKIFRPILFKKNHNNSPFLIFEFNCLINWNLCLLFKISDIYCGCYNNH